MATRASIEFNFNQAKRQADKIDGIAEKLKSLSGRDFGNTLQNLSANWKGENASAYLSKGERLQEKMDKTGGELRSVASDIRTIARRIYDAEMKALEIAERREYEQRMQNSKPKM